MKCYVACVFVSALDVKWFSVKHYHSRGKPDLVYTHFRRYLSSYSATLEFATNMPNSLAMLIHGFWFVFIHKPRAIPIIYTLYLSFNPDAVER